MKARILRWNMLNYFYNTYLYLQLYRAAYHSLSNICEYIFANIRNIPLLVQTSYQFRSEEYSLEMPSYSYIMWNQMFMFAKGPCTTHKS